MQSSSLVTITVRSRSKPAVVKTREKIEKVLNVQRISRLNNDESGNFWLYLDLLQTVDSEGLLA